MSDSSNNRVGQRISNYQLVRLVGHGGFADVYLGEHIYLKTLAAVKVLHARTDDADQADILNEARAIAQLEHPNIIRLFEYGIADGYPFLIMSYAARGSLRNYYPRGSRLPAALIVSYVRQLASALDYAHQNRLIHRDVKPENMLLGQNEQLLLTDFGLVVMAQTSRSQSSDDLAGTVAYMAPEQLRGRPRFASDQYALGVVIYEWLCGKRPFSGSFAEVASQQVLESPPSLCALVPGLASEVEQVVFKAMAKNAADRFESVGEFACALGEAYGSSSELTQQRPTRPPLVSVSNQVLQSQPFRATNSANQSLSSSRLDSRRTVEIPIDEAMTSIYDVGAADQRNTIQAQRQSSIQILSTAAETITPDTALQTFQPVIETVQTLPVRHRRAPKKILILISLLFLIGGSSILGFHQLTDVQKTQVEPGIIPLSTETTNGPNEGTSTAGATGTTRTAGNAAASPTATSIASTPTLAPVSTKPSLLQRMAPVATPTSIPQAAAPTPEPPTPTSAPIQDTPPPAPTPDPNATPTPELDTLPTPDSNITVPTPDTNLIPGLMP